MNIFDKEYWDTAFTQYSEPSFTARWNDPRNIISLMQNLAECQDFELHVLGQSVEGRPVKALRVGHGPENILIWAQMHGDEPTGCMAIFDVLNAWFYLPGFETFRTRIMQKYSIWFVPQLNPDGAFYFTRRNIQGVDVNRDACALQSPEAIILHELRAQLQPRWAFNLHDQDTHYRVGLSDKPATFSFLSPSFDEAREVDSGRSESMQLIAMLHEILWAFAPGCIGRYSDAWDPRCFGDNFQSLATNTILFESGGFYADPNRNMARKMNFVSLFSALISLLENTHHNYSRQDYLQIPENRKDFADRLLTGGRINNGVYRTVADVALWYETTIAAGGSLVSTRGFIFDVGDLHRQQAYVRNHCPDWVFVPGKIHSRLVTTHKELDALNVEALHRNAIIYICVSDHLMYLQHPYFELVPADFAAPVRLQTGVPAVFVASYKNQIVAVNIHNRFFTYN